MSEERFMNVKREKKMAGISIKKKKLAKIPSQGGAK